MEQHTHLQIDRRSLVLAAAGGGLVLALAGCAGGSSRGASAGANTSDAPGPLWPDDLAKDAGRPLTQPSNPVVAQTPPPAGPVPGVIPRSAWTAARPIDSRAEPMKPISRITVHHSAIDSTSLRTSDDVARQLEGIRREHVNRKGKPFADIGYHYIIDPSGRVWEGRPLRLQGAHVENQNEGNLGIMVMGNFERQSPTPQTTAAIERFVALQMRRHSVRSSRVFTHREIGKSTCPGSSLQRFMVACRGPSGALRNA
ncbi:MAG: N-acetylmuramoyl-L-alanine amidase [Phycisphaeraceae bacterium]|nr:MAG: N-acetylmuramoyl-L-alanine amidase [Phycisphaeraceae bacterium]